MHASIQKGKARRRLHAPFCIPRLALPLLTATICLISFLLPGHLSRAGEFSKPTNTVGFANCFGEVQFTGTLGTIELARGEIFDLYYTYGTWEGLNSPHLGRGFSIPLLQSQLIDHDYFLEVTTLGGATAYLYRLPQDPDRFLSLDGKQEGRRINRTTFIRSTGDGFVLEYVSGQLSRFKSPGGATLNLDYQDGVCRTIRGGANGTVLAYTQLANYRGKLVTRQGTFALSLQPYPVEPDPEIVAAGLATEAPLTLAKIDWPDGATTSFRYHDDASDPSLQRLTMNYEGDVLALAWKKRDGQIRAAGSVRYEVRPLSRTFDASAERIVAGSYSIRRSLPNGRWKQFTHNEDHGIMEESSSKGTKTRTHLIVNRGPSFNKVRKQERENPETGEWETNYRAFYDTQGRLIREVEEGDRLVLHVRPDDDSQSSVARPDNDLVQYDEAGRVVYTRLKGTETRRRYFENESYREVATFPWGEVRLRYLDDSDRPIPPGETFPEGRALQ